MAPKSMAPLNLKLKRLDPQAVKAAVAAAGAGVQLSLNHLDDGAGASADELLSLTLESGDVITDSNAIARYLGDARKTPLDARFPWPSLTRNNTSV
jgi:glutathione S-transferase